MSSDNLARNIASGRNRHFSPWNIFSALLLLTDEASLNMARRVMESFGISVFAASSVLEAERILHHTRLDLAICDFEVPCAADLSLLQASSRWRGLSIGLMPSSRLDQSSHKRIQVRIPKPVSVDMLVRSLKASYTNMAQQRIAAYRHTLPVKLVSGTLAHRGWQRTLQQVSVLNVSQTGLCLNAVEPLPHGAAISMNLVLPETSSSLHASGNVVWSHSSGRAGVVFDRAAGPEMRKLQEQLKMWLPRELGIVARTA
ncbi:MAG TPA: PilZ domain-containing protein [Candidatus Angelobacter sp.]|jgi:CheY-like chemotaxis protein